MNIATATEMQNNFGRYLNLVMSGQEIIVTKNGREVGRFIPKDAVVSYLTDSLTGILKEDYDLDEIKKERLSSGGTFSTVVDIKMLAKKAIDMLSSSVIIAHNHPSGNLTPSTRDILMTRTIQEAGEILGIRLLDHLIIGPCDGFLSVLEAFGNDTHENQDLM